MANTYTQIYIHAVFAVKFRQRVIPRDHETAIQKYMTGIVTNLGSKLIAINNMPDHVHFLCGLKPDVCVSDLVGKVKTGSSGLINERRWVAGHFEWQLGFGAFSYSRKDIPTVARYIENQKEHHARKTFREEYLELLREFGIDYDEKYALKGVIE